MTTPHQPTQQPQKKGSTKTVWLIGAGTLIAIIVLCGVIGAFNSNKDTTPAAAAPALPTFAAAATPSPLPPPPPVPAGPATTIRKDGTYLIGKDLAPGTYRSEGGSSCYWERDSDLTGGIGSIISNGLGAGQQIVTILPTDKAFKTKRCGNWELV